MNPLLVTILARAAAGAIAAAPVPSVISGEAVAPVPSTMEEAIAQAIVALIVVGGMYLQKRKAGK